MENINKTNNPISFTPGKSYEMEDTLVTFKVAKLAKEKGFDVYTGKTWIKKENQELFFTPSYTGITNGIVYHVPTQSVLQTWLRNVHNCFIDILPHKEASCKRWESKKDVFWLVEVDYYGKNFEIEYTKSSDFKKTFNKTYEQALERGLYQALKLIIN